MSPAGWFGLAGNGLCSDAAVQRALRCCADAVWEGGHGKQQTNGTYGRARKRIPIDGHFSVENMA